MNEKVSAKRIPPNRDEATGLGLMGSFASAGDTQG